VRNAEDMAKLDLENCFEIEFENHKLYTIIDFEDGNYVAINKKSQLYFLNHDSEIRIKKIGENIDAFLNDFNGDKVMLQREIEDK